MSDDEIEYLYGWGRTKHIPSGKVDRYGGSYSLCGAYGGCALMPRQKAARPVCKHCERVAAESESSPAITKETR